MKLNKQKTILLADDDASLRRVLEFQLTENGYAVMTARDGAEALEIFNGSDFDCVITDLRMPKLSGLELLDKIKSVNSEVPVVVITAFGEVETAVTAMKAGAFDYINKPFIPINCAAIPENLIEAELFGYKRGSFTGANLDTKGKFESASGGTMQTAANIRAR